MRVVFSLFLFLLFLNLNAQNSKSHFSGIASASVGIPTGLFSSVYSFTAGGNLGAKYTLSEKSAFTGTAGFLQFFRKGGGEGISFVPVLGGFQYHFIPQAFISLEGGGAIATYSGGGVLACLVPAFGYQINPHLSAALNYTGIAQYGFLVGGMNMRLSYSF